MKCGPIWSNHISQMRSLRFYIPSWLSCWVIGGTGAIWKVRGFTLLFRVGTLWRCGNGLFFELLPLASDALLTTLHSLLENVLQTVDHFEISCLGAHVSWLEKPRNRMGRDLNWILCPAWKKWIGGTPLEHPPYSPDLAPCDFWSSEAINFEVINGLQHVFRKWVEGCKKCIACQGRYFENETVDLSNLHFPRFAFRVTVYETSCTRRSVSWLTYLAPQECIVNLLCRLNWRPCVSSDLLCCVRCPYCLYVSSTAFSCVSPPTGDCLLVHMH
jgi:hypothetical protein